MKYVYLLLFLPLIACQKEAVEVRNTVETAPFYFRLEVRDTMHEAFQPVNYGLGEIIHIYDPTYETEYTFPLICDQNLVYRGEQLVLQTGMYSGDYSYFGRETPFFGIEFALPGLQPGLMPTREAVEQFFYAGRTFEAGIGPDKANLLMRMQIDNPVMVVPSQSIYLYEPTGTLTITGVEDYTYEFQMEPKGILQGKRITCQFEGAIGRFQAGMPRDEFPLTDVAVEIQNGEAAFFVQYK
ncbi:MAG: hypothetical protein NXI25_05285 [bacterium]|nr:hypothetical protein [bacterium]